MKIVHTSDWHIGRFLNSYSLLEDQKYFLEWLLQFLKEEEVDILIVAGDIYNSASPSAAAVSLLDDFFCEVVLKLKKKVLIIAGNHDSPEKLGFSSKILERAGFFIATDLNSIKTLKFNENNFSVGITLLPFLNPSMVKEVFKDIKISNFNETIEFVYEKFLKQSLKYNFNLLCAHGLFSSSSSESFSFTDSEVEIGGCDVANLKQFENFSYIALGHLHKAQKVGENARYSGSPLKYSISEANNEKQVVLIELKDEFKTPLVKNVLFKPLRDLKIKKGKFNEIIREKSEDFVAVKLTDENFIIDPYNRLKQNFPNLLEIEFLNLNLEVKEGFKVSKKMEPGLLFKKFYRFVVGNDLEEMQIKLLNNVIEKIKKEKVNWKRKIFVRLKKYLNCEGKNFSYVIL